MSRYLNIYQVPTGRDGGALKTRPRFHSLRGFAKLALGPTVAAFLLVLAAPAVSNGCPAPVVGANGTSVIGTPCAEVIIVTSSEVTTISGGGGDDVIYANPNVVLVTGGEGDDAIYGELPQGEPGGLVPDAGIPVFLAARDTGLRTRIEPGKSASVATVSVNCPSPPQSCYGGDSGQDLHGGSGDDKIFGERGNDNIYGEGGRDALYGGIGDDGSDPHSNMPGIYGGPGNDLLSGGLGADDLHGNENNDIVRGDGTNDSIAGGEDTDTLSFATAVTPGFPGSVTAGGGTTISGFPANNDEEERGVNIRLDGAAACTAGGSNFQACNTVGNWGARYGGGRDTIDVSSFENIIGSPFADYIVGSNTANRIDGGGGADVILAEDGDDTVYGGADTDYIEGGLGSDIVYGQDGRINSTTNNCAGVESKPAGDCSGSLTAVSQRARSLISVGFMVTNSTRDWMGIYLTGSDTARDNVDVTYNTSTDVVTFDRVAGNSANFDTAVSGQSDGCIYGAASVTCTLPSAYNPPPSKKRLDSLVLAGMDWGDQFTISGVPETTSPVLLGGKGSETLLQGGNNTEDLLVDGPGTGADTLKTMARDDGALNNEGTDTLEGGYGNDLLVSAAVCNGDTINGAGGGITDGGKNNASWAQLEGSRVVVDLEFGKAGDQNGNTWCSSGSAADLFHIDDLEGSSQGDGLFGDSAGNDILGRDGEDTLSGRDGGDAIASEDGGTVDQVFCGEGEDTARVDGRDVWKDRGCEHVN